MGVTAKSRTARLRYSRSRAQSRVVKTADIRFKKRAAYAPSTARWSKVSANIPTEWIPTDSAPSSAVMTTGFRTTASVDKMAT
jgi:hypothetical protein